MLLLVRNSEKSAHDGRCIINFEITFKMKPYVLFMIFIQRFLKLENLHIKITERKILQYIFLTLKNINFRL